jgi:hypothetical protein
MAAVIARLLAEDQRLWKRMFDTTTRERAAVGINVALVFVDADRVRDGGLPGRRHPARKGLSHDGSTDCAGDRAWGVRDGHLAWDRAVILLDTKRGWR